MPLTVVNDFRWFSSQFSTNFDQFLQALFSSDACGDGPEKNVLSICSKHGKRRSLDHLSRNVILR